MPGPWDHTADLVQRIWERAGGAGTFLDVEDSVDGPAGHVVAAMRALVGHVPSEVRDDVLPHVASVAEAPGAGPDVLVAAAAIARRLDAWPECAALLQRLRQDAEHLEEQRDVALLADAVGHVLLAVGKLPQAREQFATAFELAAQVPDYAIQYARLLAGEGDAEAARAILTEALGVHPDEPTLTAELEAL